MKLRPLMLTFMTLKQYSQASGCKQPSLLEMISVCMFVCDVRV